MAFAELIGSSCVLASSTCTFATATSVGDGNFLVRASCNQASSCVSSRAQSSVYHEPACVARRECTLGMSRCKTELAMLFTARDDVKGANKMVKLGLAGE